MNIFKKKKLSQPNTENPYLNGRRSWNYIHGSAIHTGINGLFFGALGCLIGLACAGGLIYNGSQSKFVPLVYERDGAKNVISMTRADRLPPAKVDDFRTAAADFIANARLVTPDADLQRKAVLRTYAFLNADDPATAKTNEYLNGSKERNPFTRAQTEMVSTELLSAIQQSPDTWQIDWVETTRNHDGSVKSNPVRMRALVTLYQNTNLAAVQNENNDIYNPHRIFVKDYNWSKQL